MAAIKAQQEKIKALEKANADKDAEIANLKEEKNAEILSLTERLERLEELLHVKR